MAEAVMDHAPVPASAGAPGQQRIVTLAVPDMHCGGCMRKVEQALTGLSGVASARANLSARRVSIAVTDREGSAERFITALQSAGFAATALREDRPATAAAADKDYLKRLGVAGFAAANIMLLSVSVWSGHSGDMPSSLQTLFHWLSAMIALPAIAYAGVPFFSSAKTALASGRLNMDVPISLGVILATAMSLYQTVRGTEHVYFDAAITLLFFLLVGRALDQRMRSRAVSAAENLLALRSPAASVILADGRVERLDISRVQPGTRVVVAAGERVPVDARIVSGQTAIDESLITGESVPRQVGAGDRVFGGTINLSAPLEVEATAAAENTLLAEIAGLMQAAQQARGKYVRLADRAARIYAPAVHVLGAATFIGWLVAGQGWEAALTAAIAVLIITCPCALALAVPAVQVVASSRLFRSGVVLKAADGLERLSEVDTIVLDKTGTLTLGEPRLRVDAVISDADLGRAAGLAVQSRHPYAVAVVRAARARGLPVTAIADVTETAGAGMQASVDGTLLRLGSARFCDVAAATDGGQTLWFRAGDEAAVPIALEDQVRSDGGRVIGELTRRGYALEILSGDRDVAVGRAAETVGIAQWRGGQLPGDKIRRVDELKAQGRKVLMIGDGLNDAPALAAGHASLSPANAADISQTAADAVFQGERLGPVVEALTVARSAQRLAVQNFAIAVGYNIVFVPIAMAGLVTPLIAAIAMSASSIAVTANALRLARSGEGT